SPIRSAACLLAVWPSRLLNPLRGRMREQVELRATERTRPRPQPISPPRVGEVPRGRSEVCRQAPAESPSASPRKPRIGEPSGLSLPLGLSAGLRAFELCLISYYSPLPDPWPVRSREVRSRLPLRGSSGVTPDSLFSLSA